MRQGVSNGAPQMLSAARLRMAGHNTLPSQPSVRTAGECVRVRVCVYVKINDPPLRGPLRRDPARGQVTLRREVLTPVSLSSAGSYSTFRPNSPSSSQRTWPADRTRNTAESNSGDLRQAPGATVRREILAHKKMRRESREILVNKGW